MNEEKMYHIGITKEQSAKYAILPGDPGRVEKIAQYLDNPKFIASNREYTSWIGELLGEKVIVMSTGMGGPSASICVEELIKTGTDTFIRVGTCGGMQLEVEAGDLVIANAAIRMEGTSKEYLPIEYPAASTYEVTKELVEAAQRKKIKYHVGVTQSKDSFYGQHDPNSMPVRNELLNKWDSWVKAGCLASEMECSAIYSVGITRKVRTGAILLCIWNQERKDKLKDLREVRDTSCAIETAIEAIKQLIQKDKNSKII